MTFDELMKEPNLPSAKLGPSDFARAVWYEAWHSRDAEIAALTAQLTQAQAKSEMAERKEYVDFMQYISDWKKMPAKEFAETHGDDILAALGELQREARLAEHELLCNYCNPSVGRRCDRGMYLANPAASISSVGAIDEKVLLAKVLFELDNKEGDAPWPIDWDRQPYCRWALRDAEKIIERMSALRIATPQTKEGKDAQ